MSDINSPAQKFSLSPDVANMLKAQKDDVPIGKKHQAILPPTLLNRKQIEFKKSNLSHYKIWNSTSNEDMQRINEIYKQFRRKFGRNAQHLDEFFTLLSRTNQDLELVKQLILFEDRISLKIHLNEKFFIKM
ncbi:unnamed protein product (macronuclear) [Paramecium tetraurelia]|uniref:Uncharacterized protein n=1 Tax=Paramecium tetraurelia TaxID=5888 RepID=A0EE65_PARTE|nr:uncharacterized protein GSPATT00025926001 [Paramecium tetraurelia]CAK93582.1 unnamed protein product [Paramecium tetraurelia]|eukprot:XP_001460979.1 hypothetical protein (macronuclear) [Paramecium tetraurelia strain d4-2]